MPCFSIYPCDPSHPAIELEAFDAASVLHMLSQRKWNEADVYQGKEYLFSVRLDAGGFWTVFQRENVMKNHIDAFG